MSAAALTSPYSNESQPLPLTAIPHIVQFSANWRSDIVFCGGSREKPEQQFWNQPLAKREKVGKQRKRKGSKKPETSLKGRNTNMTSGPHHQSQPATTINQYLLQLKKIIACISVHHLNTKCSICLSPDLPSSTLLSHQVTWIHLLSPCWDLRSFWVRSRCLQENLLSPPVFLFPHWEPIRTHHCTNSNAIWTNPPRTPSTKCADGNTSKGTMLLTVSISKPVIAAQPYAR